MKYDYDLLVIGGGAAGLTAGHSIPDAFGIRTYSKNRINSLKEDCYRC